LVSCAAVALAACGAREAPREKKDRPRAGLRAGPRDQAVRVLDRLAGAMRNDRADRLADVADPVHGITFWGQPGACPRPLFRAMRGEDGKLTAIARERAGDVPPHFTSPDGYWREVAETIRAGLRVFKVDAGGYRLPPEDQLERATPWASLDTRHVALRKSELSCLEDRDAAGDAPRGEYRYRFRAERGYSSVTVLLVEHDRQIRVAHVMLTWHYDA
jgi:hypothetical protein